MTLAEAVALAEKANPELQAAALRIEAQAARTESVQRMRWPRATVQSTWSRMDLPGRRLREQAELGRIHRRRLRSRVPERPERPQPPRHQRAPRGPDRRVRQGEHDGRCDDRLRRRRRARARATRRRRSACASPRPTGRPRWPVGRSPSPRRCWPSRRRARSEIEARVEAGGALQADLLRARARRREREADVAERRSQQRMAQAGLARLLGAPDGVTYVPTEGPPAVLPLAGEEAEWVARALRQRPVLEAVRRKQDAASGVREEREERPAPRHRRVRAGLGQPHRLGRRLAGVGGRPRRALDAVGRGPHASARPRPRPSSARPSRTRAPRPTRCASRSRSPTAGR